MNNVFLSKIETKVIYILQQNGSKIKGGSSNDSRCPPAMPQLSEPFFAKDVYPLVSVLKVLYKNRRGEERERKFYFRAIDYSTS